MKVVIQKLSEIKKVYEDVEVELPYYYHQPDDGNKKRKYTTELFGVIEKNRHVQIGIIKDKTSLEYRIEIDTIKGSSIPNHIACYLHCNKITAADFKKVVLSVGDSINTI